MRAKPAFIFLALAAAIFGLMFTFVPTFALSIFNLDLSSDGIFLVRLFGAALIGYGVIAWFTKEADPSETRRHIILGETIHSATATLIFVLGLIQGIGNLVLLLPFIVHLSLTLWFGLLYLKRVR